MRFAQMEMVNGLWAVILMAGFFFWSFKRRKELLCRFAQKSLVHEITPSLDEQKIKWKFSLIVIALLFIVVSFMRPQWGFTWQEIKRQGLDIIVVMDVSKSMLAQDIRPNRLERSKLAVKDLVNKLRGDRIGLVAFSGSAFLTCPLTTDYNGFFLALNDLNPRTIPRGGTNLGAAIEEAINGYEDVPSKYKAVIVITDGENLQGDPIQSAKKAKEKGIKLYCIGVGTPEGELIRVENESGDKEFLKDNQGNFVKSRLNEDVLRKIALTTGGLYMRASGIQFGLDLIYDRYLSQMEKRDFKSQMNKRYHERFQIPLAIALFLLVVESCIDTRKKV